MEEVVYFIERSQFRIYVIVLGIAYLFFLIAFVAKRFSLARAQSGYETTDLLYKQWEKGSRAAKIMDFYRFVLYPFFDFGLVILYILYLAKSFKIGDSHDASFMMSLLPGTIGFSLAIGAAIFLIQVLYINTFFDMANWLSDNRIDCYSILRNKSGKKRFRTFVGNGFLIKERPALKIFFYGRVFVVFVIYALSSVLTSRLVLSLFVILESHEAFGEWAKFFFTSFDAILFYIVFIVAVLSDVVFYGFLRIMRARLLRGQI